MRSTSKIIKRLVIGLGLGALILVLFPAHIEPLWQWAKGTSSAIYHDPLPTFGAVQSYASLGLLGLALVGVVYNTWRDRRLEVMRAEYEQLTGARHLRQRIGDLEKQLATITAERDQWQQDYATLNKQHTAALLAAKEYEVHSKYGREDRDALRQLRAQITDLLKEKGHTQGFREAMEVMMVHLAHHPDRPQDSSTSPQVPRSKGASPKQYAALPFELAD